MRILVNRESHDVAAQTLDRLLIELGYADAVVATAVNDGFVPVSARSRRVLAEGDAVEVLAPMQGG